MHNQAAEYAKEVAQEIRENTPEDIFEYLENTLDFVCTVNSSGEYLGARIAITLGGPSAWIDTRTGELVVYWGNDTAREWLPGSFIDQLNDTLSEYFEMTK